MRNVEAMELGDLLARAEELGGPREATQGRAIAEAVIAALAGPLHLQDRNILRPVLPPELASLLEGPQTNAPNALAEVVAAVQQRAELERADALEQTEVLCRALAEALEPSQRELLTRRVPDSLRALFELPETKLPPSRPVHRTPREANDAHRHLSEAKPGSRHPLSEAKPEAAQRGSVARWDGERSTHTLGGMDAPPEAGSEDSLARGRPGSKRPLNEGD